MSYFTFGRMIIFVTLLFQGEMTKSFKYVYIKLYSAEKKHKKILNKNKFKTI